MHCFINSILVFFTWIEIGRLIYGGQDKDYSELLAASRSMLRSSKATAEIL